MRKRWQSDELLYLEDVWSYKPVKSIAIKLGRTELSILLKAKHLGLGSPYLAGEHLSAHQVAKILGVDIHAVTDYWIPKCGLKARKMAMMRQPMWRIRILSLMKWLKANPDKWDSRKLELYGLGSEPNWLKEKRKKDTQIPAKRFAKWTTDTDRALINFYRAGLGQREIGERMGRSENAIQRRISRLKEKGALGKSKILIKWRPSEEAEFRRLEEQGLKDTEIALELGREREHIVDHRRNLRAKGLYNSRKMVASG